jgi:hypothetical protein
MPQCSTCNAGYPGDTSPDTHAVYCPKDDQIYPDDDSDSDSDDDETLQRKKIQKATPRPQQKPIIYSSDCPDYPNGVMHEPHPGEMQKVYATCNIDCEWSEEYTLADMIDHICSPCANTYHGGGFDTGSTWRIEKHTVYIDSVLWNGFPPSAKRTVTDRTNKACPRCEQTNQLVIVDGSDWASD